VKEDMNLRTRILKSGICCKPWRHWRSNLALIPISCRTLFRNHGVEVAKLETELKEEGWLTHREDLLELLQESCNLKRVKLPEVAIDSDFPDDWTEEDFKYYLEETCSKESKK
jgi:hypothetical protein